MIAPTIEELKVGTRVRRTGAGHVPRNLTVGHEGTIVPTGNVFAQVFVQWDGATGYSYSGHNLKCLEIIVDVVDEWEGNLELE